MDCLSVPPPNPSAVEVVSAQLQFSGASRHQLEPSKPALLRDPREGRMSDVAVVAAAVAAAAVVEEVAVVAVVALM